MSATEFDTFSSSAVMQARENSMHEHHDKLIYLKSPDGSYMMSWGTVTENAISMGVLYQVLSVLNMCECQPPHFTTKTQHKVGPGWREMPKV